jgi:outer membrane protein TolC
MNRFKPASRWALRAALPVACGLLWTTAGCTSLAAPASMAVVGEIPAAEETAPFPAPPREGYAWDELARRAAERSEEAKALQLEALVEQHQVAVDTAWRDPQLRLGSRQGDADKETLGQTPREWETRSSDAYEVGLRIFVGNPFVNTWLRKKGAALAQAKEAASQETAYAVFCEVRSLCLEAATLHEEIGLLEQIATLRTQARDIRSRQAAAGVAGAMDLVQAVTRVAAIRSDLRDKEAEYQQFVRRIAILADVPADQIRLRPPAAEPLPDVAATDVATLADLACARRPDLVRVRQEQAAAQNGVGAAQAGLLPWLDYVEGAYEDENTQASAYQENRTGFGQTDQDSSEWQLRLAVNIPIFDWDGREIRLSRAKLAAAAARADALRGKIRAEVAGARDDALRARIERDRIAEESQRVLAVMNAKIDELAQAPSIKQEDLLATREDVAAYARILLRADRECRRRGQALESAVGGPLAPPP